MEEGAEEMEVLSIMLLPTVQPHNQCTSDIVVSSIVAESGTGAKSVRMAKRNRMVNRGRIFWLFKSDHQKGRRTDQLGMAFGIGTAWNSH